MAIYIRPFKAKDLKAFTPIEPMEKDELTEPKLAAAIEKSRLSITGIRDGKIVGCGGVHPISDEQGELWIRISKDCLQHPIDTYRWLKSALEIIEETYPFRQLNAVVNQKYRTGIRLIEHFGFKKTQYHKGQVIYSKLVRDN